MYSSVPGLAPGILVFVHQTQAELLFGVQFCLWPRSWYSCFCTPNPGRTTLWCTVPPLSSLLVFLFLYTKPRRNFPLVYTSVFAISTILLVSVHQTGGELSFGVQFAPGLQEIKSNCLYSASFSPLQSPPGSVIPGCIRFILRDIGLRIGLRIHLRVPRVCF